MKKLSILGIAVSAFVFAGNAAWLRSGGTPSPSPAAKSLSGLAVSVESREIISGSIKSQAIVDSKSNLSALSVGGLSLARLAPVRWKDSTAGPSDELETITTQIIDAKQFVPEAGTWAAAVVVAGVAFGNWYARRRLA
jgi:hypothetical protein